MYYTASKNLTSTQLIRIGMWTLLLIYASIFNLTAYYAITESHAFGMVVVLIIAVFLQFLSLFEIYLAVSKNPKRGASKR